MSAYVSVIRLDRQWHGVPWANFAAWYIVVTSYSGSLYWSRLRGLPVAHQRWLRWLYPLKALIGALLILGLANILYGQVLAFSELWSALGTLLLLLGGGAVIFGAQPRAAREAALVPLMMAVPLMIHLYINALGFAYGYYQESPVLAVVALAMFAGGLGFLLWPWWRRRAQHECPT